MPLCLFSGVQYSFDDAIVTHCHILSGRSSSWGGSTKTCWRPCCNSSTPALSRSKSRNWISSLLLQKTWGLRDLDKGILKIRSLAKKNWKLRNRRKRSLILQLNHQVVRHKMFKGTIFHLCLWQERCDQCFIPNVQRLKNTGQMNLLINIYLSNTPQLLTKVVTKCNSGIQKRTKRRQ